MENTTKNFAKPALAMLLAGSLMASMVAPLAASASSHREAPLISADAQADNTDVYAFVSPDKADTVTLIASFNPFEEPAGGPNFFSFGDDVMYAIHIDNDGDAMPDVTYEYMFKSTTQNGETFLYNTGPVTSLDDADLNVRQSYTLTKVEDGVRTVLGTDIPVAPNNVGPKSMPDYAALSNAAVRTLGSTRTFAGPTDDAFFVELGGIFDLLTIRTLPGNMGGGIDGLAGYNVHSLALQVPTVELTKNKDMPTDVKNPDAVIGVWSTTSRRAMRVLNTDATNGLTTNSGDWIQVSRLGAPLVNEVVLPISQKDKWNRSMPMDDAQFANYVTNPELGGLFKALYNIMVPPQGAFGTADQRDDLIAIFLTGIPELTQPANVKPSEQLRLNVAVAPAATPNSLGVLAGDAQGYPNGRRLADDVTDISLRAVAGAAYPLFHPDFTVDATGAQLGDGVDMNDVAFRAAFPYLALPHDGFSSMPHGQMMMDEEMEPEMEVMYPFPDVTMHTDYMSIQLLKDRGIVQGYADGMFHPGNQINRAEFVKILLSSKMMDADISGANCFPDVMNQWFAKYVCTAKTMGLIDGYANGMFNPDDNITVEEAYKIVAKLYFPTENTTGSSESWYKVYMDIAVSRGFALPGITAGNNISRAQMATIIASIIQ